MQRCIGLALGGILAAVSLVGASARSFPDGDHVSRGVGLPESVAADPPAWQPVESPAVEDVTAVIALPHGEAVIATRSGKVWGRANGKWAMEAEAAGFAPAGGASRGSYGLILSGTLMTRAGPRAAALLREGDAWTGPAELPMRDVTEDVWLHDVASGEDGDWYSVGRYQQPGGGVSYVVVSRVCYSAPDGAPWCVYHSAFGVPRGSAGLRAIAHEGKDKWWAVGEAGLVVRGLPAPAADLEFWCALPRGGVLHDVLVAGSGEAIAVGTDGVVARLSGKSCSTERLSEELRGVTLHALGKHVAGAIWAVGSGGEIWSYRHGRWARDQISSAISTDLLAISFAADGTGWAAGAGGQLLQYRGDEGCVYLPVITRAGRQ